MGFLKKLGYVFLAVLTALVLFVLLCAFNPGLTNSVSNALYGEDGRGGLLGGRISGDDQTGPVITASPETVVNPELGSFHVNLTPYMPYDGTITTIPENVLGRSGYTPVSGTGMQLTEKEATDAEKAVGQGSDGSDLVFNPEIYPYYAMLDETCQKLYRQIYANIRDVVPAFSPCVDVNVDQVQYTFEAVFGDHPEFFYAQTAYTEKYTPGRMVIEIDPAYYTLTNDLETARNMFESSASVIEEGARAYGDDYSREKFVHDALVDRVVYDASAPMDQSAYSALVEGRTVCAGYARAFQYIMQRLGIPAYYCAGTSGEDHAWNIVKLAYGYYNVDVTWDDTDPASYDYFNRTDADYAGTHVRKSLSVYLPPCGGTAFKGPESGTPGEEESADIPEYEGYDPYFDPFINKDPVKPLDYEEEHAALHPEENGGTQGSGTGSQSGTENTPAQYLAVYGLKESDVLTTVNDYYKDCKVQMVSCGKGYHTFVNVVPESLFRQLESEYGKGSHMSGYMESALKTIGASDCNILIQAERLGGGYYRVSHLIYVW